MKVVTLFWQGDNTRYHYTADDVGRLYDQLVRNVSDLEFVVYVDKVRDIPGRQVSLEKMPPQYWSEVEVFREPGPMVYMGLDTVVRGNIDDLPFDKVRSTQSRREKRPNVGVVCAPKGNTIWADYRWNEPGITHIRRYVEETLPNDRFASFKWDNWGEADVVYFHGNAKPRAHNWLNTPC